MRMLLVTAFSISQYKGPDNRLNKPFNPILGETYELLTPDYKYFAEQVSHHPPVTALHSESKNWIYTCDTDAKISFNGTYVKAIPHGKQIVRLRTKNEVYVIDRPTTCVNNILFGTMYSEQIGNMTIKNATTGAVSIIEFKAEGWGGRNKHEVSGYLYYSDQALKNKDRANSFYIFGKYSQTVNAWKTDAKGNHADPIKDQPDIKLWEANPTPERAEFFYNFTQFATSLNYLTDKLKSKLPRSDCRLRPDIRAYEEGNMELAANEKHRLEEKQRLSRRLRAEGQMPEFESKYF